ncbi:pilus assembly protein PilZ [Thiopseudomonas alkaliphila]|uniref:Pilus assembly protein PilZ n=1 Tax=Thiopseudomonas alkaliphila TaxID=1697053 RepID=A0A0K1XGI5_9GAMM|nr:PilZ domain-containing protein [Thiopseudomonas alkaliphila]AKX43802.1 pilus assembly protein PilZ [Thiopseudomonas alkaliphila]AKX46058.1 pilus assembly protein PilZ [Thiopseudomonas alkaliphila]AKX49142.1 pilus assembly protein PilZ [Thiopseudomonas alkaliphila]AKX51836.1 pilus assembly protein PilZ [Thiopseudomonas alkaliphila]AKX52962.1 pilus assembly protein PilZ [Thiopseudomonas alkaliphila]
MALGKEVIRLTFTIKDVNTLYASYMPFVSEGGLFIPTSHVCAMGDEVLVLLTLLDEPEKIQITGTVIWVTPLGAQGNKPAGIGIQFREENSTVRKKIEAYLAGAQIAESSTFTL